MSHMFARFLQVLDLYPTVYTRQQNKSLVFFSVPI